MTQLLCQTHYGLLIHHCLLHQRTSHLHFLCLLTCQLMPSLRLRVSAPLIGGWKLVARRGSSAQEVFLTTSLDREALQNAVDALINAA